MAGVDWLQFKAARQGTREAGAGLQHSAKGTTWKVHKYTAKEKTKNGKDRYVYGNNNSDDVITSKIYKMKEQGDYYLKEKPGYIIGESGYIDWDKKAMVVLDRYLVEDPSLSGKIKRKVSSTIESGKNAIDKIFYDQYSSVAKYDSDGNITEVTEIKLEDSAVKQGWNALKSFFKKK